jgi:DNA-nicking Smr family endonuclease
MAEPPRATAAPPKPRNVHPVSDSIEEEDNIFLNAMGVRPRSARVAPAALAQDVPPAPLPPGPPAQASGKAEFGAAMGDLKGLKPLAKAKVQARSEAPAAITAAEPPPAPAPAIQPAVAGTAQEPGPEVPPDPPQAAGTPAPPPPPQVQIHLAAGMAVVVDGSLDLKGHALSDAEERLKERILDGFALGWRTLHVVVGSSPELKQMVLDLLKSPAGGCVARYAQAPVPMGGAHAWILYFRGPGSNEN